MNKWPVPNAKIGIHLCVLRSQLSLVVYFSLTYITK